MTGNDLFMAYALDPIFNIGIIISQSCDIRLFLDLTIDVNGLIRIIGCAAKDLVSEVAQPTGKVFAQEREFGKVFDVSFFGDPKEV